MLGLRPATFDDYPLFAELFPELETGDETPDRERFRRDLLPDTRILLVKERPVGYLNSQVLDGVGYVRQIVIRRDARRTGLARQALLRFADELRTLGCRRWCLNVNPDNRAATRLYQALGMGREYGSAALRISWDAAARLPPASGPLRTGEVPPALDRKIEESFGLVPGLLTAGRESKKALCAVFSPDGEVLAVASFDPHFPGAFPFRARRPELVQPLLAEMRGHARPGDPEVHLVIEGDGALAEYLVAHGALVKLRFDHYGGEVPPAQGAP